MPGGVTDYALYRLCPEVLSSASNKANLFAKSFPRNSNLDVLGISLFVSPSRTNLKLHNISVSPKMVKKVITNIDLSKASGADYFRGGSKELWT